MQDVFALTSLPLPGYIVHRTKDENQLKGKLAFKLFHIGLKKEYYFQADDRHTLDKYVTVYLSPVGRMPRMGDIGFMSVHLSIPNRGGTLCAQLGPNRFTYLHTLGANRTTYLSF